MLYTAPPLAVHATQSILELEVYSHTKVCEQRHLREALPVLSPVPASSPLDLKVLNPCSMAVVLHQTHDPYMS